MASWRGEAVFCVAWGAMPTPSSQAQVDDDRRVIAGLFTLTGFDVDGAGIALGGQCGAEQDVVDAQAHLAAEGHVAVIPPGVAAFGLIK